MGLRDTIKKVGDRVDVTCDKCGKLMKPGGVVKRNIAGVDHQFCSDVCAKAFRPGEKAR